MGRPLAEGQEGLPSSLPIKKKRMTPSRTDLPAILIQRGYSRATESEGSQAEVRGYSRVTESEISQAGKRGVRRASAAKRVMSLSFGSSSRVAPSRTGM